jgi:hypothetical protein
VSEAPTPRRIRASEAKRQKERDEKTLLRIEALTDRLQIKFAFLIPPFILYFNQPLKRKKDMV